MPFGYTIAKFARIKGCHPDTVRRAIKSGRLPYIFLNDDTAPERREIRIPLVESVSNWTPRQYRRNR